MSDSNSEFPLGPIFDGSTPNQQTFDLMVVMLGCLLFRLGGQQVFTIPELDEIKSSVGRIRIIIDQHDRLVLTVKPLE